MINLKTKSPKILVIGDLMIDHYLWGSSDRVSPEAPVQIVNIESENTVLGGAGNVINNLCSFGAKVDVISVIGNCAISKEMKYLLREINVDTKYLTTQNKRKPSKKTRLIASQQQVVRYDRESNENINNTSEKEILINFANIVDKYECILLSDYGKGVLTNKLTQSLIKISNKHNKKILVDPKGSNYSKYKGAYLLTPNRKEASEATNINIVDEISLIKAITKLHSNCELVTSIITLSENGIAIFDNEFRIHPTVTKEVFDVTGAGDTVLASLGFALASDCNIDEAIQFSNLAAGVVVGKIGSSTATINEIIDYELKINNSSTAKHIKSLDQMSNICNNLKSKGKKIIFTNGCFDILHAGHISYLEAAKNYGDILLVGVNSDKSVTNIKGINRPINNQSDRVLLLTALESVDYVMIFEEDTPYELIKALQPNVLVKGGDYKNKEVVGEDIVEEVKFIEFVKNKSTSNLIRKILKSD
jgi:D-beta-D-heptose 7-phosphate kinase / D-beta-D-heptose 1-phosphate adenosyltransferase